MTSSTSSEDPSAPPAIRRFPPRDQLPPGVTVEHLRGLGTTWYERGFSYWARRIGATIVLAALVALWTVIVGAIIHHTGPAGSPAFIAILTAEIVVSLVTGVWEFRRNWAHPSPWTSRDDDRTRTAGAWAGSLGSLIRTGNVLAGFVIGILALLSYGGILAAFVMSLARELPSERAARQRFAEELEHYRFLHHDRSSHHHKHRR
jgi:hypothetical protein